MPEIHCPSNSASPEVLEIHCLQTEEHEDLLQYIVVNNGIGLEDEFMGSTYLQTPAGTSDSVHNVSDSSPASKAPVGTSASQELNNSAHSVPGISDVEPPASPLLSSMITPPAESSGCKRATRSQSRAPITATAGPSGIQNAPRGQGQAPATEASASAVSSNIQQLSSSSGEATETIPATASAGTSGSQRVPASRGRGRGKATAAVPPVRRRSKAPERGLVTEANGWTNDSTPSLFSVPHYDEDQTPKLNLPIDANNELGIFLCLFREDVN